MNGVIYARYSSDRQTEQSIEGQLRECREYADSNNINIIGTYIDRAKTGLNDNRAEFQRMLRDSKNKLFDTVIVWKIDRFGRSREDIAKNKAILRRNGVSVQYAKEHIPQGAEGIILEGLLESLAEYYSAELREKITRGMRESAYKCQYNGSGLSIGYSVDSEHKYQVDPEGAKVVHLIFDLYDQGNTIANILRCIKSKGIKTRNGKEFTHFAITRVLRNRQYIGEYRWSTIIIPGGMPRIISDEQFERVNREMDKSKKAPARSRGEDITFLLTGKAFCGHCKSTMIGDSGTSKSGNKFYYYSCHHKKHKRTCNKKSVKKDWLEREVTRLTTEHILQDDIIEYIADRVTEIQREERNDKSTLDYLTARLKETQNAINNIMKAIEAGVISETTGERLRELETDREQIKIDIKKEEIALPVIEREQVIYFLNQFKNCDIEDKEYQRQIIDIFVSKIYLYDDKIIITYNYSGTNNETTAQITAEQAETAAITALSSSLPECSTKYSPLPPNNKSSSLRRAFIVLVEFGSRTRKEQIVRFAEDNSTVYCYR